MPTNPVPNSPVRTQANVVLVSTPQEDLDDVSVTNSEVESVMNRHCLKEAMRASALSEQEFTTLISTDAYVRAARDGLAGVIQLFLTKYRVVISSSTHGEK